MDKDLNLMSTSFTESASCKNIQDMIDIVTNQDESPEITGKETINQIQAFLLSEARQELLRIIRLTEFLDKIESIYTKKVLDQSESLSIYDMSEVLSTITSLLNRSNQIISSITKDDTLSVFINSMTTNNTIVAGDQKMILDSYKLNDPVARDKVRSVVQQVLYSLKNFKDNSVIEPTPPATDTVEVEGQPVKDEDQEDDQDG